MHMGTLLEEQILKNESPAQQKSYFCSYCQYHLFHSKEKEKKTLCHSKKGGGLIFNDGLVVEKKIASVTSNQKYSEAYFH